MIGGAIALLLLGTITSVAWEIFRLFQLEWACDLLRWPFWVLNYPIIYLFHIFLDGQQYQESLGFLIVLPTVVVYNCFLFAVFCEIVRLFFVRKKFASETATQT